MRSFTNCVFVVSFILLITGGVNAEEVSVVSNPAPGTTPVDGLWWMWAKVVGGATAAGVAFRTFLKKNNVDVDDPRIRSIIKVASQAILIGVAILVLRLAVKLRGDLKKGSANAKFIDSVLSELVVLSQWSGAAVVTEKFAPNMDPRTLASSLGAKPGTIEMLVASSISSDRNSSERTGRGRTDSRHNEHRTPRRTFPNIENRDRGGFDQRRSHG